MPARILCIFGILLLFPPASVHPQGIVTIEYEKVQIVRSLSGVVLDPSDVPMSGVAIEEFTSDWKTALRSTETDEKGRFAMTPVKGRKVYFLRFSFRYCNPIQIRVKTSMRGKKLQLKMEPSS